MGETVAWPGSVEKKFENNSFLKFYVKFFVDLFFWPGAVTLLTTPCLGFKFMRFNVSVP